MRKKFFLKIKTKKNSEWKIDFMKKNIARLGIEPQNCKMSCFETLCLSPQDHEISIGKWLIYQYINIGKSSTKPPKCPNLLPSSLMDIACLHTDVTLLTFTYNMNIYIFIHIYASNMYLIAINNFIYYMYLWV